MRRVTIGGNFECRNEENYLLWFRTGFRDANVLKLDISELVLVGGLLIYKCMTNSLKLENVGGQILRRDLNGWLHRPLLLKMHFDLCDPRENRKMYSPLATHRVLPVGYQHA